MQPAGKTFISRKLKIKKKLIFKFYLATISVSKVASFKPNGANYIDEDTTINTEQVNSIIWITRRFFFFFSKELWSISATSNRQGDEEIYARGSHIIWTYPLRDIQCPSYMEFTTDTIPKKVQEKKITRIWFKYIHFFSLAFMDKIWSMFNVL